MKFTRWKFKAWVLLFTGPEEEFCRKHNSYCIISEESTRAEAHPSAEGSHAVLASKSCLSVIVL